MEIDVQEIEKIIRHVADTVVLPKFKNLQQGEIREKNPGDFVTVADEESERIFTQMLAEALPGSLVVGEEAVSKDQNVLIKLKSDKPVWVIDPIDGTYNFSHGRSKFGILIALVKNGVTQYGFAFDAPGNRMAVAQKGAGAFLDGRKLHIRCEKNELGELTGQAGGAQAWHFDSYGPHFKELRNFRCSLHDYMSFLTGEADFILHVNKVTPWDHAAGCLLAQEAGGYAAIDEGAAYNPSYFGRAVMITAPTQEWWSRIHAALNFTEL